jgi:hypothetical protein
MENSEIAAQADRLLTAIQPYFAAGDKLLAITQNVDRTQPRLTAEMRRTGILPQLSAYFEAGGAVFKEYATLIRVLERTYKIEGLSKLTGTGGGTVS